MMTMLGFTAAFDWPQRSAMSANKVGRGFIALKIEQAGGLGVEKRTVEFQGLLVEWADGVVVFEGKSP
jgi:hypothetical protein